MRAEQVFEGELRIAEKFIEEGAAQALRRAAETREQSPRHFLWQLEAKDIAVEIGEKRGETFLFLWRKSWAIKQGNTMKRPAVPAAEALRAQRIADYDIILNKLAANSVSLW